MSLTSTVFYAFLIAGLLVYYILPAKFRWVWLLIMSYVYYWGYNVKSSLYMVFDTVIIYFAAMLIWKINDSSKKYLAQNKEILTKDEKKEYKKVIKQGKNKEKEKACSCRRTCTYVWTSCCLKIFKVFPD